MDQKQQTMNRTHVTIDRELEALLFAIASNSLLLKYNDTLQLLNLLHIEFSIDQIRSR